MRGSAAPFPAPGKCAKIAPADDYRAQPFPGQWTRGNLAPTIISLEPGETAQL